MKLIMRLVTAVEKPGYKLKQEHNYKVREPIENHRELK